MFNFDRLKIRICVLPRGVISIFARVGHNNDRPIKYKTFKYIPKK